MEEIGRKAAVINELKRIMLVEEEIGKNQGHFG